MKRAITLSAMMIGLFGALPAAAQTPEEIDARYSRTYERCMDDSGGITINMMNCLGLEINKHDTKLDQSYTTTMKLLNSRQKISLRNLQRKWIHHRDNFCDNESSPENGGMPGTIHMIMHSACILRETIKRTIWLERYRSDAS